MNWRNSASIKDQPGGYRCTSPGNEEASRGRGTKQSRETGDRKGRARQESYEPMVLKGQEPAAPLGGIDFVVKGVMIGEFALVAAPAEYDVTDVKTFIVGHDGIVYEKDLGPQTLETFKSMECYNPDKTWHPVQ